jgi:hypothetical protein
MIDTSKLSYLRNVDDLSRSGFSTTDLVAIANDYLAKYYDIDASKSLKGEPIKRGDIYAKAALQRAIDENQDIFGMISIASSNEILAFYHDNEMEIGEWTNLGLLFKNKFYDRSMPQEEKEIAEKSNFAVNESFYVNRLHVDLNGEQRNRNGMRLYASENADFVEVLKHYIGDRKIPQNRVETVFQGDKRVTLNQKLERLLSNKPELGEAKIFLKNERVYNLTLSKMYEREPIMISSERLSDVTDGGRIIIKYK